MRYIIYETTNLVNQKKYRGAHSTENIDDGYLGSGKLLKKAIKKYGVENFKREILHEFDSLESMYEAENSLVDKVWIEREDNYNLKVGGEGGWDYINKHNLSNTKEVNARRNESIKKAHANGKQDYTRLKTLRTGMTGYKHTEESRLRLSLNNGMKLSDDEIDRRTKLVMGSGIDFSKFGWCSKLSPIINMKPQKVSIFMERYMNEFYVTNCFRKKITV